ncbi:hypothetical protein MCEMSEM23_01425 [Rhabdaerophilaceae bacterium]
MIEQALFFGLGSLVAALAWLLFLPAFWRRAMRLSREAIEQSLPLTPNEIAAERDRLRAEHAVRIGQMENTVSNMRNTVVAAKAETGERLQTQAGFLDTIAERDRRLSEREAELARLEHRISSLESDLAEMRMARALAETTLAGLEIQRDALTSKLNSAVDLAEDRRHQLSETRQKVEHLSASLETETRRNAELRSEVQAREIAMRDLERRAATLENDVALAKIRRGDGHNLDNVPPSPEPVARAG